MVFIDQAVILLERGQTDKRTHTVTDTTYHPNKHRLQYCTVYHEICEATQKITPHTD